MSEYLKDPTPSAPSEAAAGGRRPGAGGSPSLTPRLVLGLFVVLLGLALFVGQLGYDVDPLVRWWPLLLVIVGGLKVWQPAGTPGRVFGGLLVLFGTLLLVDRLTAFEVDFGLIWPALLVAAGGALAWQAVTGPARRAEARGAVPGDTFSAVAVLGSVRRQVTSASFRGGDATAVLGGCDIDLRQAGLAGGEAVIESFALWGGIDIVVPDDWEVELRGTPILGGFEDKTRARSNPVAGRLVVTGLAIMGGVDIKSP